MVIVHDICQCLTGQWPNSGDEGRTAVRYMQGDKHTHHFTSHLGVSAVECFRAADGELYSEPGSRQKTRHALYLISQLSLCDVSVTG